MASMLEVILSNHSPFVIGYGGWNGDVIMEALRRRLSLGADCHTKCIGSAFEGVKSKTTGLAETPP